MSLTPYSLTGSYSLHPIPIPGMIVTDLPGFENVRKNVCSLGFGYEGTNAMEKKVINGFKNMNMNWIKTLE